MKIIDLLNKIANGEELPKKIKYEGAIYQKDNDGNIDYYFAEDFNGTLLLDKLNDTNELNEEIEIIEGKEIEKIVLNSDGDIVYYENGEKHRFTTNKQTKYLTHKINEIIDEISKLKKGENNG